MAVGQAALRGALDVAQLDAVETRLEVVAVARCFEHARLLREVLALHGLHVQAGMGLATVPQTALLLQLSESAARTRLDEALLLLSLPGGLEALECGLLSVEQSAVLLRAVGTLELPVRLAVWRRLQTALLAALAGGTQLDPPALRRRLAGWVIAADPAGAQERRRTAEADGEVSYRRREDGLGDLFATAIPGPLLQAVLSRIRAAARPWGSGDQRSAGKRRLDALVDLVLGRETLPTATDSDGCDQAARDGVAGRACGSRCGCRLGAPVPCGTEVVVHVPLGAALGTTDELAELVGHGPLDPEQLAQLLLSGPRLRAVHVDARGVPVSVDTTVLSPPRDDPEALRRALLELAARLPGTAAPQHPNDHRRPAPPPASPLAPSPLAPAEPVESGAAHPPGTPGGYRPPRWLRRLVQFRAPRCEWPGCGMPRAGLRLRARLRLARRPDLRLQHRAAVPPPPPDQAARAVPPRPAAPTAPSPGPTRPAAAGLAPRSTTPPPPRSDRWPPSCPTSSTPQPAGAHRAARRPRPRPRPVRAAHPGHRPGAARLRPARRPARQRHPVEPGPRRPLPLGRLTGCTPVKGAHLPTEACTGDRARFGRWDRSRARAHAVRSTPTVGRPAP